MLEEAPCIAGRHCLESPTHRLYKHIARTGFSPSQQSLELGKRFFYGVEVRGVGRQVEYLAALLLHHLPYPRTFVRSEVVHPHDLARQKSRSENFLYVGFEHLAGGGPLPRHRRTHPRSAHARKQGDVLAPVARRLKVDSVAPTSPPVDWRERSVRRTLVHEHETPGIRGSGYERPPSRSQELVPL